MRGTLWATVYGPPSVLKGLIDSSNALKSDVMMLPAAFGLSHAPHLMPPNLQEIIGENHVLEKRMKTNYKLISGHNYTPIPSSNLRKLLQVVLEDICQHPTSPEDVFEAGISFLDTGLGTSLYVLGNTTFLTYFKRTLQRKGLKVVMKSNGSIQENLNSLDGAESVAVVGMSGRFPGSDTVQELWKSIMEQKEFHRKVRMP